MQSLQLQALELQSSQNLPKMESLSPVPKEISMGEKSHGSFEEILSSLQLQKSEPYSKSESLAQKEQVSSEREDFSKSEVARNENKAKSAESKDTEKISDSDKNALSKSENEISKKVDSDKSKTDAEDSENAAISNPAQILGLAGNENFAENLILDFENAEANVEVSEADGHLGKNLLSEKNLSWLKKGEDVSNDKIDFALLSGSEDELTESDILSHLHEISEANPKMFLEAAEKLSFGNENADFDIENLKNAFNIADKKSNGFEDENKLSKKITVRDYRTAKIDADSKNADSIVKSAAKNQKNQLDFNLNQNETAKNQVTFELNARADATQNILASSNQAAGANGSTFETMLSQSIQTNAPDFVKAGTVILKDDNKGSINLILHPESLGNVKVNLSLSDKTLSGVITVQSQEAFNAFKENLETLKNAFAQNGFENVDFNLNFSNGNEANQQFAQGQNDEAASRERAKFAYGEYISLNPTEDFTENYITDGSYAVNLVA